MKREDGDVVSLLGGVLGRAQGVEGEMLTGGVIGVEGLLREVDVDLRFSFRVDLVVVDCPSPVGAGLWVGGSAGVLVKRRALIGLRLESLGVVGRAVKLPGVGNIGQISKIRIMMEFIFMVREEEGEGKS
jgi:hypothetical protein